MILQDITCGDSLSGTWDGIADGALTFHLELTQSATITWDARGSTPNDNPTVGLLIEYMRSGTSHGTADNDDVAIYPDEQDNVEFLMEMAVPAGSYNLTYEKTEGHNEYSYFTSLCMSNCPSSVIVN